MNMLATRTTGIFAAMAAVIIMAFAAAMTVSAQTGPERPTDLTATATHHDTVSLNWSHPEPTTVDHYQVLSRRADSGTGIAQVGTSTTTSFEHDGLEPQATYIYRVRAVNSQGEEGQRSARAEATTPAEETPAPPQRSDDTANAPTSTTQTAEGATWTLTGYTSVDPGSSYTYTLTLTSGTKPTNEYAGFHLPNTSDNQDKLGLDPTDCTSPELFCVSFTGNRTNGIWNNIQGHDTRYSLLKNASPHTLTATFAVAADAPNGSTIEFGAIEGNGRPRASAMTITVSTSTTSDDATLSTLVLQDASDNSVLTLDPTFDSATLAYGATVGRDVGEITIIPTPNDTDADHEIQDGDGTALTDADTTQDEFQVSIAAGLNTIQVEVTAEDTTTQTYAVTVTRPRILVSSTGQTSGGITITGNNAGTQTKHAQKFTTGSNPAGYTLDDVRIYIGSAGNTSGPVITVNSGSGTNPGSVLYTMTNPATLTSAEIATFTAPPGATLDADTNYFIVMVNTNTAINSNARYNVGLTTSDGEDSSGLSDWDIDDTGRTGTPGWSATSGDVAFRIQVRGTVDVDPATLPEIRFHSINANVREDIGSGESLVLIVLSAASADTVTVDYATSDITAEAGSDYTETSGTFTFAAGETAKTIMIPLFDDDIYETNERLRITLSNPTGATIAEPLGQVTIVDDESPPTASIANVTVSEGAGTMTLTLNLSHESSRSTGYFATTSDVGGTATQGADYENFLSGGEARITVPAGDTQASLDITITDDAAAEGSETITIRWDNDLPGGDATPDVILFTGTITDNDSSDATLSALTVNDGTNDLTLDPTFVSGTYVYAAEVDNAITTVTLTATVNDDDAEITAVTLAGTAIADTDFTDGIAVPSLVVGDNEIVVTATAEDASIQDYTVTVTRHSTPPEITFLSNTTTALENHSATAHFGLVFSHPSTKIVTVDYAAQDDTAEGGLDYQRTDSSGTLTYEPGQTGGAIVFHMLDDNIYESDEQFFVVLSNPTNATLPSPTATVTIRDSQPPPTASIDDVIVSEDASTMTLTLYLSHESKFSTSYETTTSDVGGTATAGSDYVNFLSSDEAFITVPAGDTQASLDITITDDMAAESSETITIRWENDPSGGNGDATPASMDFTGTITDNDSADSNDATLSALAVNDGTNDLTLDPTFASATYAYEADVDNAITQVTITATPNHTEAEVSAVTLAGTALADTDFSDGITVPSLVVGDNVIVVTVTAEDASTQTYTMTVARGIPYTEVPANWSFIPPGLNTIGDEFRLIFVSKTRRGARATDIASYNTWIQDQVASGHHNVKAYSSSFKVLGCTEDVDARDNTRTTATGVPTYWLGGNKVADDYPDLYDRNWDDEANPQNELAEVDHNTTADNDTIWTGCKHNGTEVFYTGTSRALGRNIVQVGKLNRSAQNQGPLESSELTSSNANRPMYGLSDLFRVVAADSNNPPVFTDGTTQTRSFAEAEGDTAATSTSNIGNPFPATDSDSDTLAYTLGGTDAGSFKIDADTGQIKQKNGEIYDYEAKSAYSVTVTVHDGTVSVTADVTINLTDVSEVPIQMDTPIVVPTPGTTTMLEVGWDEPPNAGRPPITGYKVQYQESGMPSTLTSIADVTNGNTNTSITGLQLGTAYEVRTLAVNDDGDGAWSPFGEGTTLASLGPLMTVQDSSAGEDSSFLYFQLDFSETLTENIFFDYTTSIESGDTAEDADFDAETVTEHRIQPGGDIAFITIDPNDDDLYEGDETFTITFSNLVNVYGTGDNLTATGTIIDDENQPTLEVSPASATEGDDIIFLVDLIGPLTEEDVTFNYATSRESDDNSESNDFTRTTGTETIAAGNSAAIITVPTHDDGTNHTNSLYEGDETFTFTIFNPTVAGISHATAKGTILDDERIPTSLIPDNQSTGIRKLRHRKQLHSIRHSTPNRRLRPNLTDHHRDRNRRSGLRDSRHDVHLVPPPKPIFRANHHKR